MSELAIEASALEVLRGKRRVIEPLSFQLRHGEWLALLGPNGAGKSTLLRALCGLLPSTGGLQVAGSALRSLSPRERAMRLAFLPQAPSLDAPLPVHEVVGHGRYPHGRALQVFGPADRSAVIDAMRRADVTHLADRAFTQLSQGERQRVMLARALCTGARILCLDEPTASLDVAHALQLYALLRELTRSGYAVITSLHPLADALRFADRALLLAPGHGAMQGALGEVLSAERVRAVYGVEMASPAGVEFSLPATTAAVVPR